MSIRIVRQVLVSLVFFASLVLLVWGAFPNIDHTRQQTLTRLEMQVSTPSGIPGTPSPAVPEERLLTLDWPSTLRQGDANRYIRLTLDVSKSGEITPSVSTEGDESIEEQVQIPNVYDTHNVMAEARLDMSGLAMAPDDLVSLSLRPGESVTFLWNVRAAEVGTYRGTVWLYLRFLPLDGGPESRDALKAIDIDITTVNFLGIGGPAARIMGILGVILCGMFGFGDLINAVRWLQKRIKKMRQSDAD